MKTDFIYRQFAWLYDYPFGVLLKEGHVLASSEIRRSGAIKIAELGIGPGHSLAYYPTGTELTGIDLSDQMVNKARERLKEMPGITAELAVMDATNTTLPDNTYDLVTSFSVITVVDDPAALLKEAVRICKPGGTILIVGRLERPGVFDRVWRTATHRLSLFLFGFATTMKPDVYDSIADEVKILRREQVNHVGPWFTLSDIMILEKNA